MKTKAGMADLKLACDYINELLGVEHVGQRKFVVPHLVKGAYPGSVGFQILDHTKSSNERYWDVCNILTKRMGPPKARTGSGSYLSSTWTIEPGRDVCLQLIHRHVYIRLLDFNCMEA